MRITGAEAREPYTLELTFDDGSLRGLDISAEIYGPVFEPLCNPAFFAQVAVDDDGLAVTWPNGADLSPEYLRSAPVTA